MMRRCISLLLTVFLCTPVLVAQKTAKIVTDRNVYIAGENILCSVATFEKGKPSSVPAIAYVELVSRSGLAASTKVALIDGRGAGSMKVAPGTPTGVYDIFAFSSDSDYATGSEIWIFNTESTARVKDGVVLSDTEIPGAESRTVVPSGITVESRKEAGIMNVVIRNNRNIKTDLAVSVFEEDGLRAGEVQKRIPHIPAEAEPEGEIVRAKVFGNDAELVKTRPWLIAIISAPGSLADTYTGCIDTDGSIIFQTNNIFGDRDLVCEILGAEEEHIDCHFAPVSPFYLPEGLDSGSLALSKSMKPALSARHRAMKQSGTIADTLYKFLPKRDNLLLSKDDCERYFLDDYTRFPTVEDIILELIPNVVVRKERGGKRIKITVKDVVTKKRSESVLVALDGVPVTRHDRLLAYDAMALSEVQVYPYTYAVGKTVFCGVVNFVTTKHDMSALAFDDNVRIIDFTGCSYPVAMRRETAGDVAGGRTLLWHPSIELGPGEEWFFSVPAVSDHISVFATDMLSF